MQRTPFALAFAGALLFGCGGSGTGPYERGLNLAAIAGDYGGTYTMSVTDGTTTGAAQFTVTADGTLNGLLIPAESQGRHVAWFEVTGRINSNGELTGQAVYTQDTPFSISGTVAQKVENQLSISVVASDGATISVDLARS